MSVNVEKLDAELRAAGIPIDGCSSTGQIDYRPEATQAQRDQGAAILAAHDPATTEAQRLDALAVPRRLLVALAIRASSRWTNLSAARKTRVQAAIDDTADRVIAALD